MKPIYLDAQVNTASGDFSSRMGGCFMVIKIFRKPGNLLPMTKTRFRLDEDMKFEFVLDQDGKASAVKIHYRDGRPEVITNRN